MTDTGDTRTNLANTIRGLKNFDGSNPADFKARMKKFCVVIGVTRRDILVLLKGEDKLTDTAKIADYNRTNEDLYAMLYLLIELPAALCVQTYEERQSGARSTGLPRTATKSATAKEQHDRTSSRASLLRARAPRTALRETASPPTTRHPPPRTTNHQAARSPSSTSPAVTTTSTAAPRSQQQPRDDSPPAPRAQRYWSTAVCRNYSLTTN